MLVIKFKEKERNHAAAKLNQFRLNQLPGLVEAYDKFVEETELEPLDKALLKDIMGHGIGPVEFLIEKKVKTFPKLTQGHALEEAYKQMNTILKPAITELQQWKQDLAPNIGKFPYELIDVDKMPISEDLTMTLEGVNTYIEENRHLFEVAISDPVDLELHDKYTAMIKAFNEFVGYAQSNDVLLPKDVNRLFDINQLEGIRMINADSSRFLPHKTNAYFRSLNVK
ncbi:hypothetical protein [Echinicola rosea]|uniref:Uncharacterized protein n=1 Tax=Echinicola rosea TaxID=1807691 RepID=A0ABQ1V1J9_9BACT|nr:hypothetical protein [Echinicola rosea]GGF34444.1 hypothetical protein GCM10011339_23380 [Echinicola rosea]